jgi:hypothetical protein
MARNGGRVVPLTFLRQRKTATGASNRIQTLSGCYDEASSARCLSFRQRFSSPASTDSSSPRPHPSCSSSSDGSSMMTSPVPSPGSWHTTRQFSDAVVIDWPSCSRHSMAASSRAVPLRMVGQHWPVSDDLIETVATQDQTSVCSAISRASSTSIPRYRTVLSSFV